MAHTPGPYTITGPSLDAGRDGGAGDYAIWADGRHIGDAICHTFGTLGVDHYEDALANARLWKAAPKMLEACEALIRQLQATGCPIEHYPVYEKVMSAIALTKGEQL